MIHSKAILGTRWRLSRRLMTVCVLAMYLLAGALHHFCALDVTGPTNETIVSLVNSHDDGRQGDEGLAGEHHCHGCFTFAVSTPPSDGVSLQATAEPIVLPVAIHVGHATGIDPPPPKFLT